MIKSNKKLIYADDVRRELLWQQPELAFIVDRMKPVDAMKVIRCSKCKNTSEGDMGLICLVWGSGTSPNGWCYKAEGREE